MSLLLAAQPGAAVGYTVFGEMETLAFLLGQKPIPLSCRFTVAAGDCRFRIETVDTTMDSDRLVPSPKAGGRAGTALKGTSGGRFTTQVWCFDGTDSFFANAWTNGWVAYVRPGMRLEFSATRYELLWLAFASGCYVASLTNSFMVPPWPMDDPRLQEAGYQMPAHYEVGTDALGLLRSVAYMNEGLFRGYDQKRGSFTEPLAEPYSTGYTNAVYEVLALTNTPVGMFPRLCVFTRYDVRPGYSGPVRTVSRTEIKATGISFGEEEPPFRPSFGDVSAQVTDFRLHGNVKVAGRASVPYDYVRYYVSGGSWPSATDLASIRLNYEAGTRARFAAERASAARATSFHKRATVMRFVLLGTMLVTAGVIFLVVVLKHRNQTKQKKG